MVLNREVWKGFIEKMTFEQRFQVVEEYSQVDIWKEHVRQKEKQKQRPCGDHMLRNGGQDGRATVRKGNRPDQFGSYRPFYRLFYERNGKFLKAPWKEPFGHSILMSPNSG